MLVELVFHHHGKRIRDFRTTWATAFRLAAVPERLFHDLRPTEVRNIIRAGVPERLVIEVSGHRTRSMFDRYNIVNEQDLRDALQRTQLYLARSSGEERSRKPVQIQRPQ